MGGTAQWCGVKFKACKYVKIAFVYIHKYVCGCICVCVCVRTISQVFIVSGSTRGLIRTYALRVLVVLRLSSEVKPNNLANE